MRFKLAAGLGEPWCRDGGIPQGCPLSVVFIIALYVSWCRHLDALPDVKPLVILFPRRLLSGLLQLVPYLSTFRSNWGWFVVSNYLLASMLLKHLVSPPRLLVL